MADPIIFKAIVSEIESGKEKWEQEFQFNGEKLESGFVFPFQFSLQEILNWFRSEGFHFRSENQVSHDEIKRITLKCAASYKKHSESTPQNDEERAIVARKAFTKRLPRNQNCTSDFI